MKISTLALSLLGSVLVKLLAWMMRHQLGLKNFVAQGELRFWGAVALCVTLDALLVYYSLILELMDNRSRLSDSE